MSKPAIAHSARLRLAAELAELRFVQAVAEGTTRGPDGLTVVVNTTNSRELALIPPRFEGIPVTVKYEGKEVIDPNDKSRT